MVSDHLPNGAYEVHVLLMHNFHEYDECTGNVYKTV